MQLRQQGWVVQELGVETPGFQSFLSPGLALGLWIVHSLPPFLILPPSSLPYIPPSLQFLSPSKALAPSSWSPMTVCLSWDVDFS